MYVVSGHRDRNCVALYLQFNVIAVYLFLYPKMRNRENDRIQQKVISLAHCRMSQMEIACKLTVGRRCSNTLLGRPTK